MKHVAILLMLVLAAGGRGVIAQEVLSPPTTAGAGDLPPDMSFGAGGGSGALGDVPMDGETIEPIPQEQDRTYDDGTVAGSFGTYHDPMHLQSSCPTLFESSGTWLRRGFWYAEGDYLLVNKSWDRKGLLFAFEGNTSQAPGFVPGTQIPGFGQILALNTLLIDGSKPGADGMARVTLGRFLFRDSANRDHNLEATYVGGGSWKQDSMIESSSAEGIQVNDFIDRINPSFDGAENMAFEYQTDLDSFETNYKLKSRLKKDQMVLRPDGSWVRSANTSQTYSFLVGLRYLQVSEDLDITAERMEDVAASQGGNYEVETRNRLFGGQLGASVAHETARWSIGATAKGGSYWNRMHLESQFLAGPELVPSRGETDSTEDNLSFVGEFELLGKWHLRPNMSLRVGFQVLYVDSIALAPHQVNFVPGGYPPIADDGDVVLLGSSVGLEVYR